jgi:hypothetical protein
MPGLRERLETTAFRCGLTHRIHAVTGRAALLDLTRALVGVDEGKHKTPRISV